MNQKNDLKKILLQIDNNDYKQYKKIQGIYKFKNYYLYIDHIQPEVFASLSKIRIRISQEKTSFPEEYYNTRMRNIALCDYLARTFQSNIEKIFKNRINSSNNGIIFIDKNQQEILYRSSIIVNSKYIEVRFSVKLPIKERRILARQTYDILFKHIPKIIKNSLIFSSLNKEKLIKHISIIEDAEYIRNNLSSKGLVAFIKNGSILPRKSGTKNSPKNNNVIPFKSPKSMEVEFFTPNEGRITGMGIPKGITLITGGGYHGKSTLLNAIQFGVYNHIPGDGREFTLTIEEAMKIKAESDRHIEKVDISAFINNLPSKENSHEFTSQNASDSISQATNILEAIESGIKLILLDEDTSVTNFLIKDTRMQDLIPPEKEPITPFLDRIQELYKERGVSVILAMGVCGEYLDVANKVIMMDSYVPKDLSLKAKKVAQKNKKTEQKKEPLKISERFIEPKSINPYYNGKIKIKVKNKFNIYFGNTIIDLSSQEQLIDIGQTRLIGDSLFYLKKILLQENLTLNQAIDKLYKKIIIEGFDSIVDKKRKYVNNYALARKFEIISAVNRLSTLKVR